jgi:hypothetical protein
MPGKSAPVKDEKQYEALKDKGMSKERAAKIANSPGASSNGGKKSGSGGNSSQGGTTAEKEAGRKGGKAFQHSSASTLAAGKSVPIGAKTAPTRFHGP